jgi:hypothetical protein
VLLIGQKSGKIPKTPTVPVTGSKRTSEYFRDHWYGTFWFEDNAGGDRDATAAPGPNVVPFHGQRDGGTGH